VFSVASSSPSRVPRLACQAVRYFGQHGLASNPWHPAGATLNTYIHGGPNRSGNLRYFFAGFAGALLVAAGAVAAGAAGAGAGSGPNFFRRMFLNSTSIGGPAWI